MDNDIQIIFVSDDATGRNTATYADSKNSNIKMDNSSPVSCRSDLAIIIIIAALMSLSLA